MSSMRQQYQRALRYLVGGVNSPVRAFKSVGGEPFIASHGKKNKIYDVDGKSYTDYCLSWGALIHGHAPQFITDSVEASIALGSSFGVTTKPEIDLAEFIVKHTPSMDLIRFVNSGTEATMSAVRLARGFTQRSKIIKFDGCYHGHCDYFLAKAGSGVALLPESSSKGVIAHQVQDTLSLPFNDVETFEKVLKQHQHTIACVILEPVCGNMGVILPKPAFLKSLRDLTDQFGVVLIFDEVMTGFRPDLGSAQKDLGIIPDLTCLGKIIGAGFPIGAYGGKKELMSCLSPLGHVYQAGTFSGHPLVMRAGLTALQMLKTEHYLHLQKLANHFVAKTNKGLKALGESVHFVHYHSMISIRFSLKAVDNYTQAQAASSAIIYPKLFHYLLGHGVYWPPADLEAFFLSTEHTLQDMDDLSHHVITFFKDKHYV